MCSATPNCRKPLNLGEMTTAWLVRGAKFSDHALKQQVTRTLNF